MKRYLEIRETVRGRIGSGEWPVGYRLPREIELCRELDASRTTVRRALAPLVEEGLLRRVKGTGTFVSRPHIFDKTTFFIESFAEELKAQGLSVVTEVLECRMISAEGSVAEALGVPGGERLLKLRRLRYSRELPIDGPTTLTTSYFPERVGRMLESVDFERVSLFEAMKRCGIVRAQSEKTISATHLTVGDCRLLGAKEGDIFLVVTTVSYDREGSPVEYCESFYPVDRNVFRLHVVTD